MIICYCYCDCYCDCCCCCSPSVIVFVSMSLFSLYPYYRQPWRCSIAIRLAPEVTVAAVIF